MVKAIETRKHSSRMCTARLPYRLSFRGEGEWRLVVLLKSSPSRGWAVLLGGGGPPRDSPSEGVVVLLGVVLLGGIVILGGRGGSPSRG